MNSSTRINQVGERLTELEVCAKWEDCKLLDKQNCWSCFVKNV